MRVASPRAQALVERWMDERAEQMSKQVVAMKAAQKLETLTKELMLEAASEETAAADLQTYANIARMITKLATHLRMWKEAVPGSPDTHPFDQWDGRR